MHCVNRIKFFIVPLRGLKEDLYVANVDITGMSQGIHSTHDGRYDAYLISIIISRFRAAKILLHFLKFSQLF